jgi:putative intracellular protease/amidase
VICRIESFKPRVVADKVIYIVRYGCIMLVEAHHHSSSILTRTDTRFTALVKLLTALILLGVMTGQIKIGVFIPNEAQTLDVATVDILGSMSKEYLGLMTYLPSHIPALAPNVTIYYITTPKNGKEIPLTSGMVIKSTHLYTDDEVAPGKLDIVLIPGPDPRDPQFDAGGLAWLVKQAKTEGVDILSVCTGAYICGASGIADGKKFSGPRGVQDDLKKRYPKMNLVGDDHRWVRDGNIWSSGRFPSPSLDPFFLV